MRTRSAAGSLEADQTGCKCGPAIGCAESRIGGLGCADADEDQCRGLGHSAKVLSSMRPWAASRRRSTNITPSAPGVASFRLDQRIEKGRAGHARKEGQACHERQQAGGTRLSVGIEQADRVDHGRGARAANPITSPIGLTTEHSAVIDLFSLAIGTLTPVAENDRPVGTIGLPRADLAGADLAKRLGVIGPSGVPAFGRSG